MGDDEITDQPVIDTTPAPVDWQYLKGDDYVNYWKNRVFGTTDGIDYYKTQEDFDKQKGIDATAKGLTWLKSKLDTAVSANCKTDTEYAAVFEKSGNGLDVYEKVFTMPDGGILVKGNK